MNLKENDVVFLGANAQGNVIGEGRTIEIAKGSKGVVVLCLGDPECPDAYEVEFYFSESGIYVLATVERDSLQQSQ